MRDWDAGPYGPVEGFGVAWHEHGHHGCQACARAATERRLATLRVRLLAFGSAAAAMLATGLSTVAWRLLVDRCRLGAVWGRGDGWVAAAALAVGLVLAIPALSLHRQRRKLQSWL